MIVMHSSGGDKSTHLLGQMKKINISHNMTEASCATSIVEAPCHNTACHQRRLQSRRHWGDRLSASPPLRLSASPPLRLSASPPLRLSASPPLRLSASPPLRLSASPPRRRRGGEAERQRGLRDVRSRVLCAKK